MNLLQYESNNFKGLSTRVLRHTPTGCDIYMHVLTSPWFLHVKNQHSHEEEYLKNKHQVSKGERLFGSLIPSLFLLLCHRGLSWIQQ